MSVVDVRLDEQLERMQRRAVVVGVIGLGYVGLPLTIAFAEAGFRVIGFDVDDHRVSDLNAGISPIQDVRQERLRMAVDSGHFTATGDFSALDNVDAVSVCVPTPVLQDRRPDLSYIISATEQIRDHLHSGQLVTFESTTYPGTSDEVILPMLEQTGLRAGEDFYLAFSPERIDPGNKKYGLQNTPKVIGAKTRKCATLASALYGHICEEIVIVNSPTSAELVKLLENTFRAVNIGLAAEFARIADQLGVDIWEVIDAAATKPFGFMPFYPGPGVGGHCIPVDPHYLLWKMETLGLHLPLIQAGMHAIDSMPHFVVEQVARALATHHGQNLAGSRVMVLGVSYKKDVADVRESPALRVLALLRQRGADIGYVDDYVPELQVGEAVLRSSELDSELLREADCVVIVTDHSHIDYEAVVGNAKLVIDTRNATRDLPNAGHVWHLVRPASSRTGVDGLVPLKAR